MKEKGLFDDTQEVLGDGPQTHFDSFRERCRPVQAWCEERFGPATHAESWRYLDFRCGDVTVRVHLHDTTIEWAVGFAGRAGRVGWTAYDGWAAKVPPAVLLAADYVRRVSGFSIENGGGHVGGRTDGRPAA